MNNIEKGNSLRYRRINIIILSAILIITGLMMFGHRQGFVDDYIYSIVISWQMLLIVMGIWSLIRRHYYNGTLLVGIGAFFLIPVIFGAEPGWAKIYWPLLLVLIGILILTSLLRKKSDCTHQGRRFSNNATYNTKDGFVYSNSTFGEVKQIVLDPIFKGAMIKNTFGSTILDLRHTTLEDGETYIDIECTFGGIEIYVPCGWTVVSDIQPVLGGSEDKRFKTDREPDFAHKLIIRGHVTFGGIEIKN